jgi:hypothetical protein
VSKAQRQVSFSKGVEDVVLIPTVVAKFEGRLGAVGERVDECAQPIDIAAQEGWELEKDGAQALAEVRRDAQEILFYSFLEALNVSDAPGGFGNEPKAVGYLFDPRFDDVGLRDAVERIVDFDGVKLARIVAQHVLRSSLIWIEDAFPFFVIVAAGADEACHVILVIIRRVEGLNGCLQYIGWGDACATGGNRSQTFAGRLYRHDEHTLLHRFRLFVISPAPDLSAVASAKAEATGVDGIRLRTTRDPVRDPCAKRRLVQVACYTRHDLAMRRDASRDRQNYMISFRRVHHGGEDADQRRSAKSAFRTLAWVGRGTNEIAAGTRW